MSATPKSTSVVKKDFTVQERHDVIMATLAEMNKGTECFDYHHHFDVANGELLTEEILLKTPMFWFMKYKWSRQEIETLFFKAHIVITDDFDRSLQATFGGDPGCRWKGGGGVKKKNKKQQSSIERDWMDPDYLRKTTNDDDADYGQNNYKFQYNPVKQDVHFQATGGVDQKDKETDTKEYGKPGWQRLQKNPDDDEKGSGPKMGKGKKPNDEEDGDAKKGKLNDFLDDIYAEMQEDEVPVPAAGKEVKSSKLNGLLTDIFTDDPETPDVEEDENGAEDVEELENLESFLSNFSETDLETIETAVLESTESQRSVDETGQKKKRSRTKSSATSIRTTITTGKLKTPTTPNKLKRWSGGLNISNKASEHVLKSKSNTLRREKLELEAINHAKENEANESVTKMIF
eukprot:CAMPEP_0197023562 /NCGR_PEP_ID=MMETSP1384-20130603/4227_1 /TAXON_ID=29189 /ORGANISM="Ammonia sp." /LENGTH=403 /DNA_ID=CAMNT_0042451787 /DNA_START=946 /DNA_END=2157 /DNA_ORIENTATION=-